MYIANRVAFALREKSAFVKKHCVMEAFDDSVAITTQQKGNR
jgi:hypothetical protein